MYLHFTNTTGREKIRTFIQTQRLADDHVGNLFTQIVVIMTLWFLNFCLWCSVIYWTFFFFLFANFCFQNAKIIPVQNFSFSWRIARARRTPVLLISLLWLPDWLKLVEGLSYEELLWSEWVGRIAIAWNSFFLRIWDTVRSSRK